MKKTLRALTTIVSTLSVYAGAAAARQHVDARADVRVRIGDTSGQHTHRAANGEPRSTLRGAAHIGAGAAHITLDDAFGALSRGSDGARAARRSSNTLRGPAIVEMFDDVESLALLPTPLQGQMSASAWTDHPLDNNTLNRWLGQVEPFAGVVDTSVGGNATQKVRMFTFEAQAPDQFFAGWALQMVRENIDAATFHRLVMQARLGQPVRAGHDAWNSSLASMWTSEAVHAEGALISTRLLWGGTCVEPANCNFWGLPIGAITTYQWLGTDGLNEVFSPCEFIDDAPAGFSVGDEVPPPVSSWHTIIHELRDDDTIAIYIDFLDGDGEYKIAEFMMFMPDQGRLDTVAGNASFEALGATHYVDNVFATGYEQIITCPGDVNGDGVVDFADFSLLLAAYGTCVGDGAFNPDADFDGNGCVDFSDFSVVLANYGANC